MRSLRRSGLVVVAVGLLGLLVTGVAHAAPPVNDDFDQATPIATLPFTTTQSVGEATAATDDPSCWSANSVWFTHTATTSGVLSASTAGSTYDTTLSAFTGSRGSLSEITCNDDYAGTLQAQITIPVVAGTSYHFKVASLSPLSAGSLTFAVTQPDLPVNDAFADATPVTALPHASDVDMTAATAEPGEPSGACGSPQRSIWYAVTLPETTSVTLSVTSTNYGNAAAYTGSSLTTLTEVDCTTSNVLTLRATAGTTYYLRVGAPYDRSVAQVRINVAPPVRADFDHYPYEPSTVSRVEFSDRSIDPGQARSRTFRWDFGDGTTAEGTYVTHRFAVDGDHSVTLTVTTGDGRTATTSKVVQVRTHDVAITRFTTPGSAEVGATKAITVRIGNTRYAENVSVALYRSTPSGWSEVGRYTQYVPVSATGGVNFPFNYTFRPDDAGFGKMTFRAVATLSGTSDALPLDNEAISTATTVKPATTGGLDIS